MIISALICSRDGSRTIQEALELCSKDLQRSGLASEILIIDNGSTDETAQIAAIFATSSKIPVRVFHESKAGKIHAFEKGVRQAKGELLTIVDDDNFVEPDFFRHTVHFFSDVENLGVIGSSNRLDNGHTPPDWFRWTPGRYACAKPYIACDVSNDSQGRCVGDVGVIPGAGMTFRRQPLLKALDLGYRFYNDGQRGAGMKISGEDVELCWLFRALGYRLGFDPRVQLRHSIHPDRFTLPSFKTLCRTIGAGALGFDPFMFTTKATQRRSRLSWTWQWQLLSKMKRWLRISRTSAFAHLANDERSFLRQVAQDEIIGTISRILADREKYTSHIHQVASGSWTTLRVK